MTNLPAGIWDNPTPEEQNSYEAFAAAWEADQVSALAYGYDYDTYTEVASGGVLGGGMAETGYRYPEGGVVVGGAAIGVTYLETSSGGLVAGGTATESELDYVAGIMAGGTADVTQIGNYTCHNVLYPDGTVSTGGWVGTPEYSNLHLNIDTAIPYSYPDTTGWNDDTSDYITGLRFADCRLTLSNPSRICSEDTLQHLYAVIYYYNQDTGGDTSRLQSRLYITGDSVLYDDFSNVSDFLDRTYSGGGSYTGGKQGTQLIPIDASTGEPYTLADFDDVEATLDYVSGPSAVSIDVTMFQLELSAAFVSASESVVAAGTADAPAIYNIEATGGAGAGGAGLIEGRIYLETGAGGAVLAGSAPVYTILNGNITGGHGGGGGHSIDAVLGGAAQDNLIAVDIASGSALAAGNAVISAAIYDEFATGGAVAGSSAIVYIDSSRTGAGGAVAGGKAYSADIVIDGGAVAAGSASDQHIANIVISGGSVAGGSATYGVTSYHSATLAGTSSLTASASIERIGSATLAGTSSLTASSSLEYKAITGSGGAVLSGVGTARQISTLTADAGISAAGTAIVTTDHRSASVSITGTSSLTASGYEAPYITGGVVAAGGAAVSHNRTFSASGGVITSGHGMITNIGSATITATSSMTISPLLVRGGSATLAGTSSLTAGGIVITSGSVSGGAECSGSASVSIITSRSTGGGIGAAGTASVTTDHRSASVSITGTSSLSASAEITHSSLGGAELSGVALNTVDAVETASDFGALAAGTALVTTDYRSASASITGTSSFTCKLSIKPKHVMIELLAYLMDDADLYDLIEDRIFPVMLPENAVLPAVSMQRITHTHLHDLDSATGMATARVQIDCWSHDFSECKEISEQLRDMLDGYSGYMDSVQAFSVVLDNEVHLKEPPANASDSWLYHIALDFLILHDETVALY